MSIKLKIPRRPQDVGPLSGSDWETMNIGVQTFIVMNTEDEPTLILGEHNYSNGIKMGNDWAFEISAIDMGTIAGEYIEEEGVQYIPAEFDTGTNLRTENGDNLWA